MDQTPSPTQTARYSGLAIASLITSLTCIPLAPMICGHLALSRIKKSNGALLGSGMAIAGLIIGYLSVVFQILTIISILFTGARTWKKGSDRAACIINQRNITMQIQERIQQQNLQPGDPINLNDFLASDITTTCPDGGALIISTLVSDDGTATVTCQNADSLQHAIRK